MPVSKKNQNASRQSRRKAKHRSLWTSLLEDPLLNKNSVDYKNQNHRQLKNLKLSYWDIEDMFSLYAEMGSDEKLKGLEGATKYIGINKARSLLATACGIVNVTKFHSHSVDLKTPKAIQTELESLIGASHSKRVEILKPKTHVEVLELLLYLVRVIGSLKQEDIRIRRVLIIEGIIVFLGAIFMSMLKLDSRNDKMEKFFGQVDDWMIECKKRNSSLILNNTGNPKTLVDGNGNVLFSMRWIKTRLGNFRLRFTWPTKNDDDKKTFTTSKFYIPSHTTLFNPTIASIGRTKLQNTTNFGTLILQHEQNT